MKFVFKLFQTEDRKFSPADIIVLIALLCFIYVGIELAIKSPQEFRKTTISLNPSALPFYTLFSLGRMFGAYILSVIFTIVYGKIAASNQRAEKFMLPVLDVLQSVPILSFLPVVVLSLRAIMPQGAAAEIGSIILIFTSQVWNMTFAWYQSLTTIPTDLKEASSINKLSGWLKFKNLEFPFGTISFIWNSMMSWAGGWFFLMAAEIFNIGDKDFRLPGLGSYLQEASSKGNIHAIFYGLLTLIFVIVLLDQFVWRPLLAWAERFKVEMVESEEVSTSWFYDILLTSNIVEFFRVHIIKPFLSFLDKTLTTIWDFKEKPARKKNDFLRRLIISVLAIIIIYLLYKAILLILVVPFSQWVKMFIGVLCTLLRVIIALTIALAWTIPVGVLIATNKKVSKILQPVVQILASFPATALFPVLLIFVLTLPFGINLAAILLMLMGTQWYLLFNIIAGASTIPQDLKYTSTLLHLSKFKKWKTLVLPALFPFLITGSIAASGGAWNASIVAEYVTFNNKTFSTQGIGSAIADATAKGDYASLLASTIFMIVTVVFINRLFWRKLYNIAEQRFKME